MSNAECQKETVVPRVRSRPSRDQFRSPAVAVPLGGYPERQDDRLSASESTGYKSVPLNNRADQIGTAIPARRESGPRVEPRAECNPRSAGGPHAPISPTGTATDPG